MVIGAGTAGAATARACARAGLSVLVVESKPLHQAGAHWLNGVPAHAFEAADIPLPRGAELAGTGHAFHMVAGYGPGRLTIPSAELLEVDMQHLVARLQADARSAGARLHEGEQATAWEPAEDGAIVRTSHRTYQARVVVDASGMRGVRFQPPPEVPRDEICVAAQETRALLDPNAATAFFTSHGVEPGDTLCFTGVSGGYSIVNVRVDLEQRRFYILTGAIPGAGHQSGVQLAEEFVGRHDWIGAKQAGGARAIPLLPPLAQLNDGQLVRVGDAARQVFAAHGSGIGAQLVAARLLADVLSTGGSPSDYTQRWHREHGSHFCNSVAFARFSRDLSTEDLRELFASGLLAPGQTGRTLTQRRPGLGISDISDLSQMLLGAIRAPRWLSKLAPLAGQIARMEIHHSRFPADPDRVAQWGRERDAILLGRSSKA